MRTSKNLRKIGLAALILLSPIASKAQKMPDRIDGPAPVSSELKENSPLILIPADGEGPEIKTYPFSEAYEVDNSTPPYVRFDYNPSKYTIDELIEYIKRYEKEYNAPVVALPYKDKPTNNLQAMPSTAKPAKIPIIEKETKKESYDLLNNSFGKTGIQLELNEGMPGRSSNGDDSSANSQSTARNGYQLIIKSKVKDRAFLTFEMEKDAINTSNGNQSAYNEIYYNWSNESNSSRNSDETLSSVLLSILDRDSGGIEVGAGFASLSRREKSNQTERRSEYRLESDKEPDDDLYAILYTSSYNSETKGELDRDCNGYTIKFSKSGTFPFETSITSLEGKIYDISRYAYGGESSETGYDLYGRQIYKNSNSYDGSYEQNKNYAVSLDEIELSAPLNFGKTSLRLSYKQRAEQISAADGSVDIYDLKNTLSAQIRYNHKSFFIGAKYSWTDEEMTDSGDGNSWTESSYDEFWITAGYRFMDKKEEKR